MRQIKYTPGALQLRDDWIQDADNVLQQLIAEADPKKRSDIIEANNGLWAEVKAELAKLSNDKCWYTESKQQGTDTDVDHFRPKKRVAKVKGNDNPHPGYWWLAFGLANYRFSCIYANRGRRDIESGDVGGKADHFPLVNEENRTWTPDCDCNEEQPLLLDPCKATDVTLITFKEDGEAMPLFDKNHRARAFERADISIVLYNINNSVFVRARLELRDRINSLLGDAKRFFSKLETGDATHAHGYERAIEQLLELIDEQAPYSGFCKAYIENHRHEDWLKGAF